MSDLTKSDKARIVALYRNYKRTGLPVGLTTDFLSEAAAVASEFSKEFPDLEAASVLAYVSHDTRERNAKKAAARAASDLPEANLSGKSESRSSDVEKAMDYASQTGWASNARFIRDLRFGVAQAKTVMNKLYDAKLIGEPKGHFGRPWLKSDIQKKALETIIAGTSPMSTGKKGWRITDISALVGSNEVPDVVLWHGKVLSQPGVDVSFLRLS